MEFKSHCQFLKGSKNLLKKLEKNPVEELALIIYSKQIITQNMPAKVLKIADLTL